MFTDDIDDDVLWIIVRRESVYLCTRKRSQRAVFFSLCVVETRDVCTIFDGVVCVASSTWRRKDETALLKSLGK